MYEKLDKLRADVARWKKRIEDDKNKLQITLEKLREAEKTQILADVAALNLTPEQLAERLKPVANGALPGQGRGEDLPARLDDHALDAALQPGPLRQRA